MLLDDHTLVREGVARLFELEPDLRVVGSFGEARAAVQFAAAERPDVAILDVNLRSGSGIEAAREMRSVSPRTQVLVLSMHGTPDHVVRALAAGAGGYLLKECAGEELVAAVRAVLEGRRYFSSGIVWGDPLQRLSRREREVMKLVVEGNTNAEVAAALGVSPKSVETYRSRLMAKLALEHLPALVKFAIRHGITTVD